MISFLLIMVPFLAGTLSIRMIRKTKMLLLFFKASTLFHSVLSVTVLLRNEWDLPLFSGFERWIGQDDLSRLILCITSFLFSAVAIHTKAWLPVEQEHAQKQSSVIAGPNLLVSCLFFFLAAMTLVISSRNFGLLWVAVEATTLASAPLILFYRSAHSIEAMWKYLLICSVGIGLALFGTMLLSVSTGNAHAGLGFDTLKSNPLDPGYFKFAFIFILAGYGTKMGLAPFHTWLPDAHSEAPGIVSALLSGTLLNCSFLGIIRVMDLAPAELKGFCSELLIALGLLSLAAAAFFIIRQGDFKRMLAYSSVEHMGLIALLWGLNNSFLSLVHLCGHSLLKMTLFLLAGNFLLACGTRKIADTAGLSGKLPKNSFLWIFACLMICGVPPSPLFTTEFLLIRSAGPILGSVILVLLFAVFAGMTNICLKMTMGHPGHAFPDDETAFQTEKLCFIPVSALVFASVLGIAMLTLLSRMI